MTTDPARRGSYGITTFGADEQGGFRAEWPDSRKPWVMPLDRMSTAADLVALTTSSRSATTLEQGLNSYLGRQAQRKNAPIPISPSCGRLRGPAGG